MMDENALWEAIQQVVESGEETPTIDLKGRLYHFKKDVQKGEFIKDAVAIANTLDTPEAKGYLVIGVLDSDQRKGIGRRKYILGVSISSRSRLEQRMNNLLREYVEPDLTVSCYRVTYPPTRKMLAVIVIPCWHRLDPFNPRPCIIKKDIGKIRRGQIFVRAGSDTYPALYTDISRLVGTGLQSQIKDLEDQVSRAIDRYNQDVDQLKDDYDRETRLLYERIDNLERNNDELKRENDRWRELSRAALVDLYRVLPEEFREKEIRRMLARFGKENYYPEWLQMRN